MNRANESDECRKTATTMIKEWILWSQNGYTSGLRNVEKHRVNVNKLTDFAQVILIKNGLWAYMYDLGVSNGKKDPKIRIYMKNRVVKCYAQRKLITQMISLCQSMKVNGGMCRLAIMMMWHYQNVALC